MMEQFNKDRDEALLSGDLEKLKSYMRKYGIEIHPSDEVLEMSRHKAITGCNQLPIELRRESKKWLEDRGFCSHDDGDL